MHTLADYLEPDALQQLQQAFSVIARRPVVICDPAGEPLLPAAANLAGDAGWQGGDGEHRRGEATLVLDGYVEPVHVDGRVVGVLRFGQDAGVDPCPHLGPESQRPLEPIADLVARMCDREKILRYRVEELSTLYSLTAEFATQTDLQSVLDLVARTVVQVLQVRACSIRLLNDDRTELVVKAVCNLSDDYLNKGPVPLAESRIDRELFETGEPLFLPDIRQDPRVLYPAEAAREGIVSALCAPLIYRGRPEGAIRVYTAEPHQFDWFEVSLLRAISAQAAAAIVNAWLNAEALRSAEIQSQLQMAATVQRRMIPQAPRDIPGFDIAAVYEPSYELSGDFYDFIRLPEENLGIAIADVVGKGVRASLLTASTRASLRGHALNIYEMSLVLDKVNRDLCADTQTSDFASMFYGVLDYRQRRLTWANAGHCPPLLFRQGQVQQLGSSGILLGIDPQAHYRYEWLGIRPGDVLIAYTDGLAEALNFDDEAFGVERVVAAAHEAIAEEMSADATAKHIVWSMRKFSGLQQRPDDLTLVVIKALEPPPEPRPAILGR